MPKQMKRVGVVLLLALLVLYGLFASDSATSIRYSLKDISSVFPSVSLNAGFGGIRDLNVEEATNSSKMSFVLDLSAGIGYCISDSLMVGVAPACTVRPDSKSTYELSVRGEFGWYHTVADDLTLAIVGIGGYNPSVKGIEFGASFKVVVDNIGYDLIKIILTYAPEGRTVKSMLTANALLLFS